MKKLFLFAVVIFTFFISSAQLLSWSTEFVQKTTTPFTITMDASKGNQGLSFYTPTTDVYVHIGVITNLSVNSSDWKYVKFTWGTSNALAQASYAGSNKWTYTITGGLRAFFGVPAGETIQHIAILFRNSNGTKVQNNTDGSYMFIPVTTAAFASRFTLPLMQPKYVSVPEPINRVVGNTIPMTGVSNSLATLRLYFNGNLVQTATAATTVSAAPVITTTGNQTLVLEATDGVSNRRDTIHFYVAPPPTVAALPAGVREGINYSANNTQATLVRYAPGKNRVVIIGDIPNSNWVEQTAYQMNKTPDGNYWWLTLTGLTPGFEYSFQYVVDGVFRIAETFSEKIQDPNSDQFISPSTYPDLKAYPNETTGIVSILQTAAPTYTWHNTTFTRPDKRNIVIYELLLRDFVAAHDWNTLRDSLNYLKRLGINAIELMPANEFEGNESWGYNPDFYFAPDKYYGPANTMKRFIDSCHSRGIAVIMDVELDHSSGMSPMAQLYWDAANNRPAANNPWFNPISKHASNGGFDINHESLATRYLVSRVLEHWVINYKIDGFRFDLSKGFTQFQTCDNTGNNCNATTWSNYDASRIAICKRYYDTLQLKAPGAYAILEHFADNSEENELSNYGMMLWGNSNYNYSQAAMGLSTGWNFDNGLSVARGWANPYLVTYMESHSEERMMYRNLQSGNSNGSYNTRTLATALKRMEMNTAFFLTLPGPKMIWQFGELGYDFSINTCQDLTVNNNCITDKKPIRWDYLQQANRNELYQVYGHLNRLRNSTGFSNLFTAGAITRDFSGPFKWHKMSSGSFGIMAIGNFDVVAQTGSVIFPFSGTWYDYLTGGTITATGGNQAFTLQPGEYRIFTNQFVALQVNAGSVSGTTPLCIGLTTTYSSTGDPGGTWSSSNTNVATVDVNTGMVTTVTAGATNIIYTVSGAVSSFQQLTVNPNANAGTVNGISPLCLGSTATFTSTGDPSGTWSTGNGQAATVDPNSGLVTAVGPGYALITYTIITGCGAPLDASQVVQVNPVVNAGTIVGLTPLCIGSTSSYSSNGDTGGTWSSSNSGIATVNGSGLVTGITGGSAGISYTVTGCGGPVSASKILTIQSIDYANLQFPASGSICSSGSFTVYGQVYESGLTEPPGAGAGIFVEFGFNTSNTDPATWPSQNWALATFNVQSGNNDEYMGTIGNGYAPGTYYYTFRYSLNGCPFKYGGYSLGGGNFWDGVTNLSGVLTVNAEYSLVAAVSPNGSVLPEGTNSICSGEDQTYTITGNACHSIADVIVDGVSQGAVGTYTFTNVTANHTISATFVLNTYTITVTAGANGSITPGTGTVNCGTNATYTITPNGGFSIADVIVDGVSQGAVGTYTFTNVTANHTISATFVSAATFTITSSTGANGSISPNGATVVNGGANQTYTMTPIACYHVDDVLVDGISVGAVTTYTFTNVTANHTISASFAINAPLATPVVTGPVNVCPYLGTGAQITYTFNAPGATGYSYSIPPTNVTLISSTANSITVTFAAAFRFNGNKQIRVTALSPCGNSPLLVFVLAAQAPNVPQPIVGTSSVCSVIGTAGTLTYTIPSVIGATSYIWTAQAGTTTITHPNGLGINDTTVNVSFTNGFTSSNITVAAANDSCGASSARSFALVKANPGTPGLIAGPTNACPYIAPGGTAATYSVLAVAGQTYTWTVPAGAIGLTGQGTAMISFTYPSGFVSGSLSVTTTNGCGTSTTARTLSINKLNPAIPGVIDVIQTQPCPNRVFTYSIAATPANSTSVQWTVPVAATLVSGQGTNSIMVTYPGTSVNGNVTAQSFNNCGSSTLRSTSVHLPTCVEEKQSNCYTKDGSTKPAAEAMKVNVYPNPTVSDFKLQVVTAGKQTIHVRIMDAQGRSIKTFEVMPYQTIHVGSDLKTGAYMMEVRQGNEVKITKLLKF